MFELTEREQKIDEQLRIVITDRNFKEESLKKELHSIKLQLASTINHNKSMVEEVTSLKKDFKQKENKYLEVFLEMKSLKEKNLIKPVKRELHQLGSLKGKEVLNKPKNVISRSVIKDQLKPTVLAPGKYAIDIEPILPRIKNNMEVHLDYLRHLKESVETLREIVEEAKVVRPLDSSIVSACRYTKHSQELLEYAIGTCPQDYHQRDKKHAPAPLIRKKQVTFEEQCRTNHPLVFGLRLFKTYDGDPSRLMNFVKKFIGTVRFGNEHFGAIMGYGDYVIGDSVISMVYYVEGLGHNLFSVKQFYDSDLEVAFGKHSYYVRDTDGVEVIKGSRGSNLYTISVEDMMKSSPICLLSKAFKNKPWLWHQRLNHLNFGAINDLARKDLVRGLPRLKFEKDHLCSACQLGKSKKHTHKPKTKNTNLEVLNTLHMDLYGPI
nr:retrovirus-related Pol polyprotein from transposon TNT 1-94 [Tanacetum cinerariifolium]